MARETFTRLVDDIDGGEAHETVRFGLDGQTFEIDLSTKNANKLRSVLGPYLESGSRLSGRGVAAASGRRRAGGTARADREQNQAIRDWAIRKGYEVAPRGRIRQEIVDEFHRTRGR